MAGGSLRGAPAPWLRLTRSRASEVENFGGWLTLGPAEWLQTSAADTPAAFQPPFEEIAPMLGRSWALAYQAISD